MKWDYLRDQLAPFDLEREEQWQFSSSLAGVQAARGGVIREAESVKCLVETQSPSLATDLCPLSEGQSWASQLPFSFPKKERGVGVEGSSPNPCNLALCHSCKLGPDICKSLPPFFYTSLFHLFSLDLFTSSNKAPFRRPSPVSAYIHPFVHKVHLCKSNTFLHPCAKLQGSITKKKTRSL